ncbi:helix-turn-helix domain-containing protein [Bradyrhizobium valentinum]|uniref:helix-turn-helix domain-containing protein n=1 Tax=Bradyrhizobium valentinum TaxID=1518501 RepID=UPI000B0CCD7E
MTCSASTPGLTLETVSRALSQLSDQGILAFSSARQIVLRNPPAAGGHGRLRV